MNYAHEIDQTGDEQMSVSLLNATYYSLAPQTRTALYLDDIFPNMNSLLVGNLRIRSDKAIYGFSLMHDSGFKFLMPLSAMPLF
jgi:hypothetical protein